MRLPLHLKLGGLALAVALALAGLQTYRLEVERRAHADSRSTHAVAIAALERSAREAVRSARDEEQRRTEEVQKAADEATRSLARARADAAAAADAGRRLREQIAAVTATCRFAASDSSAAEGGAPAVSTADLLADVQRRLDEASDGIARFADAAHIAGATCERSYDRVRSAPDSAALHR